jgi:hypothetical protein
MADSSESSARQIYGFTAWLPAGHVFLEHADVPLVNEVANLERILQYLVTRFEKCRNRTIIRCPSLS